MEHKTDDLNKETWSFYFDDMRNILYLDSYIVWHRETTRKRNWDIVRQYRRIGRRRDYQNSIELAEVPFTDDIKREALADFASKITVKTWDRN
jgi:hypothetical protein